MKHVDNCQCPKCLIYLEEPNIQPFIKFKNREYRAQELEYRNGTWYVHYQCFYYYEPYNRAVWSDHIDVAAWQWYVDHGDNE